MIKLIIISTIMLGILSILVIAVLKGEKDNGVNLL